MGTVFAAPTMAVVSQVMDELKADGEEMRQENG